MEFYLFILYKEQKKDFTSKISLIETTWTWIVFLFIWIYFSSFNFI